MHPAAEEYSEAFCVGRAHIDVLMAERASLTACTEHTKARCNIFTARVFEQAIDAATPHGELGVEEQTMR